MPDERAQDAQSLDIPGQLVLTNQVIRNIAELVAPWGPGPLVVWRDYPIIVANRTAQSVQVVSYYKNGRIVIELVDRTMKGLPNNAQRIGAGQTSDPLDVSQ